MTRLVECVTKLDQYHDVCNSTYVWMCTNRSVVCAYSLYISDLWFVCLKFSISAKSRSRRPGKQRNNYWQAGFFIKSWIFCALENDGAALWYLSNWYCCGERGGFPHFSWNVDGRVLCGWKGGVLVKKMVKTRRSFVAIFVVLVLYSLCCIFDVKVSVLIEYM